MAGFGAAPRDVCRQGAVPRWRAGPGRLVHNGVRRRQRVHGRLKRCRRRRVLSARPDAVAQRVDGRVGAIHKDESAECIRPFASLLDGLALGQRHVSACMHECRSACERVWSMSTSLRMLAQVTTAEGKAGIVRVRSRHEAVRAMPKA
jgi:hypothetical protein